jgi:hypothetical protein
MSEPISVKKLLDASPRAMIKSTSSTAKGLLVLIAIGLLGFAVWKAFIKKPDPTQTQHTTITSPAKVEIDQRQIIESKDQDVFFFGVRLWRIKLGVSYLKEVKEAVKKPVEIK